MRGHKGAVRDSAIETLRITATFLLVTYHVVGGGGAGLDLPDTHPLQHFNMFFRDLRMPLFAFIAGYVYAMRPLGEGSFAGFILGKARRLLVPGAVAALTFAFVAWLADRRFAVPLEDFWQVLLFPYAHFWFLQAIFVILLLVPLAERLLGPQADVILFVTASAAFLTGTTLPTSFFSLNSISYLLPFFALGLLLNRHRTSLAQHRKIAGAVSIALLVASCAWNFQLFVQDGAFSTVRFDMQSYAFGVSTCVLMMLFPIRLNALASFGVFSFTIYLYHVFGTAGSREALVRFGVENAWFLFACSIAAGFLLPISLHMAARRFRLTRQAVLGLR